MKIIALLAGICLMGGLVKFVYELGKAITLLEDFEVE